MSYSSDKEKSSQDEVVTSVDHVALGNVDEAKVLRKLDWHLLPFVSLLYLLSFL